MKSIIAAVVLASISTAVLADSTHHNTTNNTYNNTSQSTNQGQLQFQGQAQKQSIKNSGNSSSTSSVKNSGNSSSSSLGLGVGVAHTGDVAVSGDTYKERYQAPGMGGPASGPCTGFSGGISVPGLGINGASVDKECEKREAVRILHMIGQSSLALAVATDMEVVKELYRPRPVPTKYSNGTYTDHDRFFSDMGTSN